MQREIHQVVAESYLIQMVWKQLDFLFLGTGSDYFICTCM